VEAASNEHQTRRIVDSVKTPSTQHLVVVVVVGEHENK